MSLLQDVRFSLRALRRNPVFAATAVLCLALGIGATTAIFAVVHAVVLAPLPYEDADRVVEVWNHLTRMDLPWQEASVPEYLDYVERNEVFSQLGGYAGGVTATVVDGGEPEAVAAGYAAPGLFSLLGVRPHLGRVFLEEESTPGRDKVVLLSHGLWQRRFGADPGVVGRMIGVDGDRFLVVGVLPPEFRFPDARVQLWEPLTIDRADLPPRRFRFLHVLGRLRDGTSLEQAQAGMEALAAELYREHPDLYPRQGWKVELVPVKEHMVRQVRPVLRLLLAGVCLLLLIACVNVANLLVVRAIGREGEITMRLALGAGRRRLMRQLVTESMVLGVCGGLLGLGLARGAVGLLVAARPEFLPRVEEIGIGGVPLAFSVLVSLATGLAFGLIPALQLFGRQLRTAVRRVGADPGRNLLRRVLVVAEVALAFVLLVCAGLMIRSFAAAQKVDPGFDASHVLTLRIGLDNLRYAEPAAILGFYGALERRIAALPGVREVGAVSILPLSGGESTTTFEVEGRGLPSGDDFPSADLRVVTAGYHRAMRIPLLAGRGFLPADDARSSPVVLVDEELARRYFPRQSPIGRRIRFGSSGQGPWLTIVGLARHTRQDGLDRESRGLVYLPHAQQQRQAMTVVLRSASDPSGLAGPVRQAVRELDPGQAVSEVRTMEQVMDESLAMRRLSVLLLGGFSAMAFTLAVVGIYGVMAFHVLQRRREIGLRMALGAQSRDVLRLIVGQGTGLVLLGLFLGLGGAAALVRFLSSLIFGVGVYDPVTYTVVTAALALAGLAASYLPARRALGLDPTLVLRSD
ncbi:MAG TPA: ABC transporter permease [Thermoanaerobaculia bacterium]|nr:ABC transporter permease [Thermoanaerobaculia bacterium]